MLFTEIKPVCLSRGLSTKVTRTHVWTIAPTKRLSLKYERKKKTKLTIYFSHHFQPQWPWHTMLRVHLLNSSRKRYAFSSYALLVAIFAYAHNPLSSRAYPRDALAPCCRHTCQRRGEQDERACSIKLTLWLWRIQRHGEFGKQLIMEEMGTLLMFGSKRTWRSIFIGFVHYFIAVKKER
jgi:hypothetical protein